MKVGSKTSIITIRVTAKEKASIVIAAAKAGLSITDYLLSSRSEQIADAEVTTELLEKRLGLSPFTLDTLYSAVTTKEQQVKTATALSTLDPDGLPWYGYKADKGYLWSNTVAPTSVSDNSKTLRSLIDEIIKEDEDPRSGFAVFKPSDPKMLVSC